MYCPTCGAMAPQGFCPTCAVTARRTADVSSRFWAYAIDIIPTALATIFLGWIPVIGAMILGVILFFYWLLRDVTGASLGKRILGLRVVAKNGTSATVGSRILRNVPFAVGPALLVIPFAGYIASPATAGLLVLTEFALLLSKHERLGDRLAGTTVVKRTLTAMASAAGAR